MPDSEIILEYASNFGLSKYDFEEIQKKLERNPTHTEAFIYSNLWSDSPQNNNLLNVDALAKKIRKVLDESGITQKDSIEIDNEISCILKIESVLSSNNNTYNEAAANTINLYRNLILQNAKTISAINSFHFSAQNLETSKSPLSEFINGSSTYSNAFGAPVVGIQAYFNECNLNQSMLNSFLIGIKKSENYKAVKIPKPEDKILIIKPESESTINSTVYEKLIQETISEAFENNLIIDIQAITKLSFLDSCLNLISKTEFGLQLSLDNIYDIHNNEDIEMIFNSKSVANFLIFCEIESCNKLKSLMNNSGLNCVEIGQIIEKPNLIISNKTRVIADLPVKLLQKRMKAGEEFIYKNSPIQKNVEFDINQIPIQKNLREIAWLLIKHLNIVSKKWIFEQYDSMVGISNMSSNFPSSAALVNLKENDAALALSLEINSRYFKANPETGIQIAVSEAARKIVCTGAKPIAITASFNFLDFDKKNDSDFLAASLKGLVKACKEFNIQLTCTKANLFDSSFSENSPASNCLVPIIGMIGILKDKNHQMTISFKNKGNIIFLVGQSIEDISSSEYLYSYHQVKNSPAPWFNLGLEHKTQCAVQELIEKNYVCSVHTVSKGGIFISLVESAMRFGLGFDIITDTDIRTDAFLFGESQGRIIVSITPNKEDHFIDFMLKKEVPFLALGHVTKGEMRVDDISFGFIEDAKREYENTFEKLINAQYFCGI